MRGGDGHEALDENERRAARPQHRDDRRGSDRCARADERLELLVDRCLERFRLELDRLGELDDRPRARDGAEQRELPGHVTQRLLVCPLRPAAEGTLGAWWRASRYDDDGSIASSPRCVGGEATRPTCRPPNEAASSRG